METLPAEILMKIVQCIANDLDIKTAKRTIQDLRLVSHHVKSIASRFLIPTASVHLSSKSFLDFEELCHHSELRLGVTHVRINASYYDVQCAANRLCFLQQCENHFYDLIELLQRSSENQDRALTLWPTFHKLRRVSRDRPLPESNQSVLLYRRTMFDHYEECQRRTADQEELRRDGHHIHRLCKSLANLPALEGVTLDDWDIEEDRVWKVMRDETIAGDDPVILSCALSRSVWSGTLTTATQTKQPLEMLRELLAQMGRSGVRLRSIKVQLSLPIDLRLLELDRYQSLGIGNLVSRATSIDILFRGWIRKGLYAGHRDRSSFEMCALGSIITALTQSSTLQILRIDFRGYPLFQEFPAVSLDQLLPVRTRTWPQLRELELNYLPMDLEEIAVLVDSHRENITSLKMQSPFLRTGDWCEALELFRGFEKIQTAKLLDVLGGRYRRRATDPMFPSTQANEFILKESPTNPLL